MGRDEEAYDTHYTQHMRLLQYSLLYKQLPQTTTSVRVYLSKCGGGGVGGYIKLFFLQDIIFILS